MPYPTNELELLRLFSQICEGEATADQQQWLARRLAEDAQMRRYWVDFMATEADTSELVRQRMPDAGKIIPVDWKKVFAEGRKPVDCSNAALPHGLVARVRNVTGRIASSFARAIEWHLHPVRFIGVIATLTIAMWALWLLIIQPGEPPLAERQPTNPSVVGSHVPTVARLMRTVGAKWEDRDRRPFDGMYLRRGRTLQLAVGLAEIKFHDGARVILQGPAEFSVTDSNHGHLETGKLVAHVKTPQAHGFQIETPSATVVDLGTEFGVDSDRRMSRVRVFTGQVNVNARGSGEQVALVAGESARVVFSDTSSMRHIIRLPSDPDTQQRFVRSLPERPPVGIVWTAEPFTSTRQIINEGRQVTAVNLNGLEIVMNRVHFVHGNFGKPAHALACYDSNLHPIDGLTAFQASELLDKTNFGPGIGNSLIPQNSISGLRDLVIGKNYVIQALLSDQRSNPRHYDFGHGPPETYTLRKIDVSRGPVLCTGRFTAHATTQTVHVQYNQNQQLNYTVSAWQLRVEAKPAPIQGR